MRIVDGDVFLLQQLGEQACREDARACARDGGLQRVENHLQQKARLYVGQARDATRHTLDARADGDGARSRSCPGARPWWCSATDSSSRNRATWVQQLAGLRRGVA